jgi:hypothetical protein
VSCTQVSTKNLHFSSANTTDHASLFMTGAHSPHGSLGMATSSSVGFCPLFSSMYHSSTSASAWPYNPSEKKKQIKMGESLVHQLTHMAARLMPCIGGNSSHGAVQSMLSLFVSGRLGTLVGFSSGPQSVDSMQVEMLNMSQTIDALRHEIAALQQSSLCTPSSSPHKQSASPQDSSRLNSPTTLPPSPVSSFPLFQEDSSTSDAVTWQERRDHVQSAIDQIKKQALALEKLCEPHLRSAASCTHNGETVFEEPQQPNKQFCATVKNSAQDIMEVACLLLSCLYGRKMDSTKACCKVGYIHTYRSCIHRAHTRLVIYNSTKRIHTYTHANMHMHACIHTYIHIYINTYIYTCMHTYIHIRLHVRYRIAFNTMVVAAHMHACIHVFAALFVTFRQIHAYLSSVLAFMESLHVRVSSAMQLWSPILVVQAK